MADKKPDPAPKDTKDAKASGAKSSKGGAWKTILGMVLVIPTILIVGLPTLLICVGLLPTLIALLTDTDRQKSAAATIGFLNVAGVLPFIIDLWMSGQTMAHAFAIMSSSTTWLVMFGSAGVGHLLLYAIPQATATLTLTRMENRLRTLKQALIQLKDIYGPDVATNKPLDQVRKRDGA